MSERDVTIVIVRQDVEQVVEALRQAEFDCMMRQDFDQASRLHEYQIVIEEQVTE